jgi:hypothetical protein
MGDISKATSFGGITDHFSLADTDLILVDSNRRARAQNRADAQDENADIVASAYSGNTAKEIEEVSCTYALKSGTLNLNTLFIGELAARIFAQSMAVTTANGAWPQIVVSGFLGLETMTAPATKTNKFGLPAITISGVKQAQLLSFTIAAGGRLTGSSITFNCEMAEQLDGVGEPAAHGVSGGTGELTAEFVKVEDSQPGWTLASPITAAPFLAEVTQEPGADEPQAGWHTTSAAASFILTRTASA